MLREPFLAASKQIKAFSTVSSASSAGFFNSPLMSAYGTALHGPLRADCGFFAEPLDAWLAVLASAVPFYQDCLIVCPSSMGEGRMRKLSSRVREHLPQAHLTQLRPRHVVPKTRSTPTSSPAVVPKFSSVPGDQEGNRTARLEAAISKPPQEGPSALAPLPLTTPTLLPASCPSALSQAAPEYVVPGLDRIASRSLDLIVFAANVFGEEMLFDAPWHLSNAYHALRPHGVLSIIGYSPYLRVVAPTWAREDSEDYLKDLLRSCTEYGRKGPCTVDAKKTGGSSHLVSERRREMRRALDIFESEMMGHQDIFFPFHAVQRRWFDSEYAMTAAEVASAFRAMRIYHLLHANTWLSCEDDPTMVFGNSSFSAVSRNGSETSYPNLASSDFVDLPLDDPHTLSSDAAVAKDEPILNVQRRRCVVDPLEALEHCWDMRLAWSDGDFSRDRIRANQVQTPPLRARVKHFVLSLSSRSMNVMTPWRDRSS